MAEELNKVKFHGVNETSIATYQRRLQKMLEITKHSVRHSLKHAEDTYTMLYDHYKGQLNTLANHLTLICKIFSSNEVYSKRYPESQKQFKEYLKDVREQLRENYNENLASDAQKDKVVMMDEIKAKYKLLKENGTKDKQTNFYYVLLSCFINLTPKRADLGNVKLLKVAPTDPDYNYILISDSAANSYLHLLKFKTAKYTKSGIKETLPQGLYDDIIMSMRKYPRDYLFVDKNGKPYLLNNSYTQFVKRTFKNLFGKSMGVSLWRHVWVTTEMNLHTMSNKEIQDKVNKMGTSEHQVKQVYKWINIDRSKNESCVTVCKPIVA